MQVSTGSYEVAVLLLCIRDQAVVEWHPKSYTGSRGKKAFTATHKHLQFLAAIVVFCFVLFYVLWVISFFFFITFFFYYQSNNSQSSIFAFFISLLA